MEKRFTLRFVCNYYFNNNIVDTQINVYNMNNSKNSYFMCECVGFALFCFLHFNSLNELGLRVREEKQHQFFLLEIILT